MSLWSSIESRYEEERKAIEEFEEQIMEIQDKHSKMVRKDGYMDDSHQY